MLTGAVCPSCERPKWREHYLCKDCWFALPALTRKALTRRDDRAAERLRELYNAIYGRVPLGEISIP